MALSELFDALWRDYARLNPQAQRIHDLLSALGENPRNDHVAFRTLDLPDFNLAAFEKPFLRLGYRPCGEYLFPEKHLTAKHYEAAVPNAPKVFVSQLHWQKLPAGLQSILLSLLNQVTPQLRQSPTLCHAGRPWKLFRSEYESLARVSEYAAWLAAFGFCANHFTVLVNDLIRFPDLQTLNQTLKSKGFRLNPAGGEIKGSPAEGLEQSSTLAEPVLVQCEDGPLTLPGCYYEFARRHVLPTGQLFSGFIAGSANRIFESTNRRSA